jgi:sucrose-6-phosphate hydrolase SacC (GH32 family)
VLILSVAAVCALPSHSGAEQQPTFTLGDKTFVVWLTLDDLEQRGGSALTIENSAEEFDGLVFGELAPGKWMPGSDYFRRTERDQAAWPIETASPTEVIQMAFVYQGREVIQYRNGREIARQRVGEPKTFQGGDAFVLLGLRHMGNFNGFLKGTIDDARIYARALDAAAIAALQPNRPGGPAPLAWWDFEGGRLTDRMGTFPPGRLHGRAAVKDGKLILPGGPSYFSAGAVGGRTRATEQWPTWHITALPEEGICMPYDANGCIWWKGKYHLMYIFQDYERPRRGHSWGHASSTDLVNWTFHPPALVPGRGDPDVGIFSGNAFVNKDGQPMLCWFGINAGVCVATAQDDDLLRWHKHPRNPVIPIPRPGQPGHGRYEVWDPFLWLEKDAYYCLLGGNYLPNKKDTLYLLKSADLVSWKPLHPFYEHPDLTWTTAGEDCSCPDFFPLGDRHVLLCISHKVGARAYVGKFRGEKFYPERHVRMNWPGGMFFAPESLQDNHGRRIFWAWVTDPRHMRTQRGTGSGFQSMPRVLSLARDGTLRITPPRELEALRAERTGVEERPVPADEEVTLDGVRGDSLEIHLDINPGAAKAVGVKVRCSADGSEQTAIWYDPAARKLTLDMSKSSTRRDITYTAGPIDGYSGGRDARTSFDAPLDLPTGEPLRLRVFLDRSMLEVFANDRQCLTQLIFPDRPDALGVRVAARGGTARLIGGQAWQLKPATFVNHKSRAAP